jgi:ankyrin repeat protein
LLAQVVFSRDLKSLALFLEYDLTVDELVKGKFRFSTMDAKGSSIVSVAAQNARVVALGKLLQHSEAKALIDAKNSHGETALMSCCRSANVACVDILLQVGASPFVVDKTGASAFCHAAEAGSLSCVLQLHRTVAEVSVATWVNSACKVGRFFNEGSSLVNTSLYLFHQCFSRCDE